MASLSGAKQVMLPYEFTKPDRPVMDISLLNSDKVVSVTSSSPNILSVKVYKVLPTSSESQALNRVMIVNDRIIKAKSLFFGGMVKHDRN